jgi:putative ABC transport system permease protein
VINQTAERAFFEGREAIGAMIRFWGMSRRVVGVVGDERIKGQASAPPPAVYAPITQAPSTSGAYVLLVRTAGEVAPLAASVRSVVRGLDESVAVYGVEALERTVVRSLAERRFALMILALFAGVALLLAALGIHGVFSYHVEQRSQEMGVRMALGAQPYQALLLLLREGAGLAAAGVGLGMAGAYALTRLMTSLLFSVTPTDPVTFGGAIAVMATIAIAATLISSRRIMGVDPVVALRVE